LSLTNRRPGRIRPQLEGFQDVLAELGNPQWDFPSALIVGTNGKGSTAAMLAAILASHGLRTGLYTSPHLMQVEERIRIEGKPVARADLDRHLARLDRFPDLTFFEVLTAVAFLVFAEQGVDCAVLEAGMGGRWDATRSAESVLAGITNVGSDHAAWLGAMPEDRATDKGDALLAAEVAVVGAQVESRLVPALKAPAARPATDLVRIERLDPAHVHAEWAGGETNVELSLDGQHQVENLRLALALALGAAEVGWLTGLDQDLVASGLKQLRWPGRLSNHQVLGQRVLVDCAHNAEGAQALADHLESQPVLYHLLFSCLNDKPVEQMAQALSPQVGNVVVCPLDDERAMPMDRLKRAFPTAQHAEDVREGLELLPPPVVVAGSIRLVGELLKQRVEGPEP
jgi:dihydrofolate synthase/folylpolyglutamate synthase